MKVFEENELSNKFSKMLQKFFLYDIRESMEFLYLTNFEKKAMLWWKSFRKKKQRMPENTPPVILNWTYKFHFYLKDHLEKIVKNWILFKPWSRKNAFLARILQDPCKNAITCKILQGNLFLARSCKEMFSLKDLARKCFPWKILQGMHFFSTREVSCSKTGHSGHFRFWCNCCEVLLFRGLFTQNFSGTLKVEKKRFLYMRSVPTKIFDNNCIKSFNFKCSETLTQHYSIHSV